MSVQNAVDNRKTDDVIVITFRFFGGAWHQILVYDGRNTPYDIPYNLMHTQVESINIVDNRLTIIEI